MLPCPFKYLTGIDCPGCGFQRSVLALLNGEIMKSFMLYPATIFIILFLIITLMENILMGKKWKTLRMVFLCLSLVVGGLGYIYKLGLA